MVDAKEEVVIDHGLGAAELILFRVSSSSCYVTGPNIGVGGIVARSV